MSYDVKCYRLAEDFLDDYVVPNKVTLEKVAGQIAQAVQDCIEDEIADLLERKMIEESHA